jgi:hypothetical protein
MSNKINENQEQKQPTNISVRVGFMSLVFYRFFRGFLGIKTLIVKPRFIYFLFKLRIDLKTPIYTISVSPSLQP